MFSAAADPLPSGDCRAAARRVPWPRQNRMVFALRETGKAGAPQDRARLRINASKPSTWSFCRSGLGGMAAFSPTASPPLRITLRMRSSVADRCQAGSVKSRGLAPKPVAAGPCPLPLVPWQTKHRDKKIFWPSAAPGPGFSGPASPRPGETFEQPTPTANKQREIRRNQSITLRFNAVSRPLQSFGKAQDHEGGAVHRPGRLNHLTIRHPCYIRQVPGAIPFPAT